MEKEMKIPHFESSDDMARFWDCHDITDFEDDLVEVKEPIFQLADKRVISLLLNPVQYDKLKKISDRKKLDTVSLINQWITKHIEQESIQPVL